LDGAVPSASCGKPTNWPFVGAAPGRVAAAGVPNEADTACPRGVGRVYRIAPIVVRLAGVQSHDTQDKRRRLCPHADDIRPPIPWRCPPVGRAQQLDGGTGNQRHLTVQVPLKTADTPGNPNRCDRGSLPHREVTGCHGPRLTRPIRGIRSGSSRSAPGSARSDFVLTLLPDELSGRRKPHIDRRQFCVPPSVGPSRS